MAHTVIVMCSVRGQNIFTGRVPYTLCMGTFAAILRRHGTNDLHADTCWFGRCDALGARDFSNLEINSAGSWCPRISMSATRSGTRSEDHPAGQDLLVGQLRGQRFVTTVTNNSTVPTPGFKIGQFTFNGQPVDVCTLRFAAICLGSLITSSSSR